MERAEKEETELIGKEEDEANIEQEEAQEEAQDEVQEEAPGVAVAAVESLKSLSLKPAREKGEAAEKASSSVSAVVDEILKPQNDAAQLRAVVALRKLLSIEKNPPISEVISTGVVPVLIGLLSNKETQMQFEACWSLTNIASGTSAHTRMVIQHGIMRPLTALIRSDNDDVSEQAVWCVGNLAGDSPQIRDLVLNSGVLSPLLEKLTGVVFGTEAKDTVKKRGKKKKEAALESSSEKAETTVDKPLKQLKLSFLRNAAWTCSNLCRGKPQVSMSLVEPLVPVLARMLYAQDVEVITDAAWGLSYLSDGANERIQVVLESGVTRRLVELLTHQSFQVQTPCLRTLGNFVTGDDYQTQTVLNQGILQTLQPLLNSPKSGIRKETCWLISNITAGNQTQIQAVIDAGLVPSLIRMLTTGDFATRKEACWAVSNMTSGGSSDHLRYLVTVGVVQPYCQLLESQDARLLLVILEGLDNLLRLADLNLAQAVEEHGGLDAIERLQTHQNHEVYEKAVQILERHFAAEEEGDSTAPAPAHGTPVPVPAPVPAPASPTLTFSFGGNNAETRSGFHF